MTESDPPSDRPVQFPAIISPGALTSPMHAYAVARVPAPIADAGDGVGREILLPWVKA
jgi:hypothetical protein